MGISALCHVKPCYLVQCVPARQLLPAAGQATSPAVVTRIRRRLSKLRGKRPNAITGRQLFLSQMLMKTRAANARLPPGKRYYSRHEVMKLHGHYWRELPPSKQAEYERQALAMRAERTEEMEDAIADEADRLQAALAQQDTDRANRSQSMMMSACRLDNKRLLLWQEVLQSSALSSVVVKKMSKSSAMCPSPLSQEAFQHLVDQSPLHVSGPSSACALPLRVAKARGALRSAVIAVEEEGELEWYRVVVAMITPCRLLLQPLTLRGHTPETFGSTKEDWETLQIQDMEFLWSYDHGEFVGQEVLETVDVQSCFVVPNCLYKAPNLLASRDDLVPLLPVLEAVEREAPPVVKRKAPTTEAASSAPRAKAKVVAGNTVTWQTTSSSSCAAPQTTAQAATPGLRALDPSGSDSESSSHSDRSKGSGLSDGQQAELRQQQAEVNADGIRCDLKKASPIHSWAQSVRFPRKCQLRAQCLWGRWCTQSRCSLEDPGASCL